MKNKFYPTILVLFVFFAFGCEKEIATKLNYQHYSFSDTDENGGNWIQAYLTGPEQISIPAPLSSTSPEFIQEIADLKSRIQSMNQENKENIEYWTNNPIIRWNEIARELVAKYNLIPAPNADNTYTLPDPANPGKYPYFPFAHPPYASRMYAYLSTAQFDGLIAAWHYKKKFGRNALHLIDSEIKQVYPSSNIPSYPSDGAVVSAISKEILIAMFPLEKEYLIQKDIECQRAMLLSGLNVQSDLTAGDSLGRAVAKIFLMRSATDGMKNAQCPKAVSDSIKQTAFNKFGCQWDNLESPVRPVGLVPLFSKVKTWNLTDLKAVRPPVPPTPGSAEYKIAAKELEDIAKNLTNEQRKIANWWSDGFNTTTPPGHWNKYASELIVKYNYNPLRAARVYAYMNMAIMDGGISCWDAKYYYHYPRPIQTIPGFKTILGTPNFPGYTSGHSVFSAAAAAVLSYIFPNEKNAAEAFAFEAAESRIYGGIHFRFDAAAGLEQGKNVATYTIQKAQLDGAK